MFKRFFRSDASAAAGASLYAVAAEQARSPVFYESLGAPDTVEGRFELTALHVWLVLRRLTGAGEAARRVSQHLFDAMFDSFDDALREMGVGDLIVGKKIRKLAENFYGRAQAYDAALKDGEAAMGEALARNVYESADASVAAGIAAYVREAAALLDQQETDALIGGAVRFPAVSS